MTHFKHGHITKAIIDAFYRLYYSHRRGYREQEFANALALELRRRGHSVRTQVSIHRRYQGRLVGTGKVDLVVDNLVAVEIKNVRRLNQKHELQLRSYLTDGGWPVGLLLNYGTDEPQVRRLERKS